MHWLVIVAGLGAAAYFGSRVDDAIEDITGGAPNPFSPFGLAVYGLAGFGAYCLYKRVSA